MQIWVLMGGEGSGRQAAWAAGRGAFHACMTPGGGGATPFLLAPQFAGAPTTLMAMLRTVHFVCRICICSIALLARNAAHIDLNNATQGVLLSSWVHPPTASRWSGVT